MSLCHDYLGSKLKDDVEIDDVSKLTRNPIIAEKEATLSSIGGEGEMEENEYMLNSKSFPSDDDKRHSLSHRVDAGVADQKGSTPLNNCKGIRIHEVDDRL